MTATACGRRLARDVATCSRPCAVVGCKRGPRQRAPWSQTARCSWSVPRKRAPSGTGEGAGRTSCTSCGHAPRPLAREPRLQRRLPPRRAALLQPRALAAAAAAAAAWSSCRRGLVVQRARAAARAPRAARPAASRGGRLGRRQSGKGIVCEPSAGLRAPQVAPARHPRRSSLPHPPEKPGARSEAMLTSQGCVPGALRHPGGRMGSVGDARHEARPGHGQ